MRPTLAEFEECWVEVGCARTQSGDQLVLRRRADRYEIRLNGWQLMSDRAHRSESALGALACEGIGCSEPRVLIGGLGMGYTMRAALDALPPSARVLVAELLPEVIAWNRGPLGHLAAHPLEDERAVIEPHDVAYVLRNSESSFDVVVLDVDNGPDHVTFGCNRHLYEADGLALIRRALKPTAVLAVWSPDRSERYEENLYRAGFDWHSVEIPAHGFPTNPKHTIYIAELC